MSKAPTKKQNERWRRLRELGCVVCLKQGHPETPAAIHHCETGGGGRKDHDKVLPLCQLHHQGEYGIHTISRGVWQRLYGTEQFLMRFVSQLLGE